MKKINFSWIVLLFNFFLCAQIPLFNSYPGLKERVPYISLGTFPTPVAQLETISKELQANLYIKNDGLSGKIVNNVRLFGGNKVRKLEFLLADALEKKADTIITVGGVGSNHALATTAHASWLGFAVSVFLEPQLNSTVVQRNLLLDHYFQAAMHLVDENEIALKIDQEIIKEKKQDRLSYVIPCGGSVPLGVIGFINAVFELKKQINQGLMPEPTYIYVPLGSMGTAAGLILGAKAAELKSKIICVRVGGLPNEEKLLNLIQETNSYVHEMDESFPLFDLSTDDLTINHNFFGQRYGEFTLEGITASKLIKKKESIILDGTYTAKTCAALLHDIETGFIKETDVVLFWNTFDGHDYKEITDHMDYKELPKPFHIYFETEAQ